MAPRADDEEQRFPFGSDRGQSVGRVSELHTLLDVEAVGVGGDACEEAARVRLGPVTEVFEAVRNAAHAGNNRHACDVHEDEKRGKPTGHHVCPASGFSCPRESSTPHTSQSVTLRFLS